MTLGPVAKLDLKYSRQIEGVGFEAVFNIAYFITDKPHEKSAI